MYDNDYNQPFMATFDSTMNYHGVEILQAVFTSMPVDSSVSPLMPGKKITRFIEPGGWPVRKPLNARNGAGSETLLKKLNEAIVFQFASTRKTAYTLL